MNRPRLAVALSIVLGCGASNAPPEPIAPSSEPSSAETPAVAYTQRYCLDANLVDSVPGLGKEPLQYAPESNAKNGKVVVFTNESASAKTDAVTTSLCAVATMARDCRNAAALKGPIPGGFVELALVIDENGKLVSAKRKSGDLADTTLVECLQTAVSAAAFSKAARGETSIFVVPRIVGESKTVFIAEHGTDIQGLMKPERLKPTLRGNFPKLRACYEVILKSKPFYDDDVAIRFVIEENGKVTNVDVAATEPGFRACLVSTIGSLQFPEPDKGRVLVTYPLRFTTDH